MPTNPTENRLNELEAKWLDGSINTEEAKEYAEWYNSGQDNLVEIPETFATSKEEHAKRMLKALRPRKPKLTPMYIFSRIAAMVLLALGLWLLEQGSLKKDEVLNETQAMRFKNDIAPGHSGAVLTLSNGKQIVLDTAGNGLLTIDGNDKVVKKDGNLSYDAKDVVAGEIAYNTLTTDKGRKFQLALPDGTKVWLNAASSIRFPLAFSGNERLVKITGEVYFEVKHNEKQPFKVKFDNQIVEDIGTSFNVNAYKDEAENKTTLLEGSVKVSIANSTISKVLKPWQQAETNESAAKIKVKEDADLEETMAWKNGSFSFKDADINTIMRQVARWYDVSITYQGEIKDTFVADISQNEPISKLLKLLELTGRVRFRIDGKKITVTP